MRRLRQLRPPTKASLSQSLSHPPQPQDTTRPFNTTQNNIRQPRQAYDAAMAAAHASLQGLSESVSRGRVIEGFGGAALAIINDAVSLVEGSFVVGVGWD